MNAIRRIWEWKRNKGKKKQASSSIRSRQVEDNELKWPTAYIFGLQAIFERREGKEEGTEIPGKSNRDF